MKARCRRESWSSGVVVVVLLGWSTAACASTPPTDPPAASTASPATQAPGASARGPQTPRTGSPAPPAPGAPHKGAFFEFTPPRDFAQVPRERVLSGDWGTQVPDEVWMSPSADSYFTIRLAEQPLPPHLLPTLKQQMESSFESQVEGLELVSSEVKWIGDRSWLRFEAKRASGERNLLYHASARGRFLSVTFVASPAAFDRDREAFTDSMATFRVLE